MKKRNLICLLLALLLLLAPLQGLADLKRGDRGEEVREAQAMMIEMGFLNDKADGIFGKKTEAAVRSFQEYSGMDKTGILDEWTLLELYDVYFTATGVMEGDGLGEDELMEMYPAYCSWEGENEWGAVFCYRHLEESFVSSLLQRKNPPEKLKTLLAQRLIELWERDILYMYEEWADSLPEEEQDIAFEQQAVFENALEEYRLEWEQQADGLLREMTWLEAQGIDLCFELHGAEPNDFDFE